MIPPPAVHLNIANCDKKLSKSVHYWLLCAEKKKKIVEMENGLQLRIQNVSYAAKLFLIAVSRQV